ncbi:amidohydrolase family protein [Fulvivirga sedimenti]|uniref:Amidohydrolase family protein n=1 Tax=Fulvivirga sedimenti TaxID=2879465 RepID=A0A9X1HPC8_9BACT|nr:amidohydrolase family protein [Fulvivirga sedimenti]MCA6075356.1 amidohydrolase family protein [Fulvivirga sedimenti]MCA6076533.1 amidohydrolase family protein [Fulvivirga sedimenti]MCA6077661.1 amidohydrolase family protein [Fulvivirga sedimenti]
MNSTFTRQRFRFLMALLLLFSYHILPAQDSKLRPVSDVYALENVRVVTSPGNIVENATIVIKNGLIHAVGQNIAIPPDAIYVKADSMTVYAGFIDGLSNAGIPKPKEDNNRRNNVENPGNPPNELAGITPEADIRLMLDPSDKSIGALRNLGFTMAHAVPYGRMLPGTGAIILLSGDHADDLVYKDPVSFYSQLEGARGVYPSTVIGVMAKYRQLYRQAQLAKNNALTYSQNPSGMERPSSDRVLEAFYPVIDGTLPVMFHAEDVKSIQRVLTLRNELGFKLMIGGIKQGWDVQDDLKSAGVPVFLSLDLPEWKEDKKDSAEEASWSDERKRLEERKSDLLQKHYTLPATFTSAGIRFGFSSMGAKESDIHKTLLKMKEKGVSEDVLLAGLTTYPAEMLGLSRVAGTVSSGKLANLVVTDKSYFEEGVQVRYVFVEGKMYEFEAKKASNKNGKKSEGPEGTWSYSAQTPNGTGTGQIQINKSGDSFTGEIKDNQSGYRFDLDNITVDGKNVMFEFTYNDGNGQLPLKVDLEMDGNTFSGMIDGGSIGKFPIKGERIPE